MRGRELNTCVLCDNACNARSHQQQSLAIFASSHERDGFPSKSAHLPIGQNRLKPVGDFSPIATVIDRVQDQHSAVGGLAADSPFLKKVDRVIVNLDAVSRMDSHHRDLGMSFLIDLPADFIHLRDRVLVQNVGKVVDVIRGFEFCDRFGLR